ncbi:hypothetical protein [Leifsonia poae]|uniref:hypothetical protein n=1 Tax=Leifsonia poae TaxID=110933 RepID=UPI003D66B3C7
MIVATATYAAVVVLVTFQAIAGQSIVHPDGVFLASGFAIAVLAPAAAVAVVAMTNRTHPRQPAPTTVGAR